MSIRPSPTARQVWALIGLLWTAGPLGVAIAQGAVHIPAAGKTTYFLLSGLSLTFLVFMSMQGILHSPLLKGKD